ncbi:MAG: GNAT family N-acetyltransferase [Phycisphaerales bacterium]|nr:GNAT family N-acetyltransferase [Phycisphaerales bacterium]
MSVVLRPMRMDLADMRILCNLLEFDRKEHEPMRPPQQRLEDRQAEGATSVGTIAICDGAPVGAVSLIKPPADVIETAIGIWVVVDPAHRRSGIGRRLANADVDACVGLGLTRQMTVIALGEAGSIEFARSVGFHEVDRGYKLVFDPTRWNSEEGTRVLQAAIDGGVEFLSINALAARYSDWHVQLHALAMEIFGDIPAQMEMESSAWIGQSPDQLAARMNAMRLDGEGSSVALVDGTCAATTWVTQPRDGVCHVPLTGSGRSFRRKGLVRALKQATFAFCKAKGVTRLQTHQHESNRPMLELNKRLGFEVQSGHVIMQRDLADCQAGSSVGRADRRDSTNATIASTAASLMGPKRPSCSGPS